MIDLDLRIARSELAVQARLHLPSRGIIAVIGRSGSGKTTLLHAIAGLVRPASGHLRWDEHTLFDAAHGIDMPAHRRAFGVVFQEGRLFPHLSVRGNLLFGARPSADHGGPTLEGVAELLGIRALLSRRPHTLSGGERQRVAIGRALLARPRALLMDEPLASLDPARRHELLHHLAELPVRFHLPIVYVTHQIDEVLRLADHVVVMSEGRVVASGSALELLSDLSLQPLVGRFEAGSVIEARVAEQLDDWQLSRVEVAGQGITVPHLKARIGETVRLRIRARDVALQRERHESSASNQLPGRVLQVLERDGPYCAVELALNTEAAPGERLWALVTRRSVAALGIVPGQHWVASFKAVAVEGRATALRPPNPPED